MLFMGVMMMLVLPLFLFISARMIANSSFGHRPLGWVLQTIFYLFIAMIVAGIFVLMAQA
jgi:hypothetical protein